MKIRISAITDKGKEREINQDAFTLCPDLSKPDWTIGCMEKYMPLGNYGTLVKIVTLAELLWRFHVVVAELLHLGGCGIAHVMYRIVVLFLVEVLLKR